jgi:ubiquinone/menaquinone biosynthesis C-methylase UbiE
MGGESDRMSATSYRFLIAAFAVLDFFFPYLDRRVRRFGIREGMTVVDYGCGPGRYTTRFARLVGPKGRVYAVDIHEMAIEAVTQRMRKQRIENIVPVLAHGYHSGLPDHIADMVCAIDMFFSVREPTAFLAELKRIAKEDGVLVIDDGHQSRATTKRKLAASGHWVTMEETRDHLRCRPV